jgi:6-phosphogluconolactonase (cycloisomerase 2 family)
VTGTFAWIGVGAFVVHFSFVIQLNMLNSTLLLLLAFLALAFLSSPVQCKKPSYPYIYVSFHGGKNGVDNIYKYDTKGNLVEKNILQGENSIKSLRSMAYNPNQPDNLYITNADDSNSRVLEFGPCSSKKGHRQYIKDLVSSKQSNFIQHPYGLVFANTVRGEILYVSNQNTNLVTSYTTDNGTFEGVAATVAPNDVRGLAYDNSTGFLYFANKEGNLMEVYDTNRGTINASQALSVADPISMFIDDDQHYAYISSNGDDSVVVYNLKTGKKVATFKSKNLNHPAGSTIIDGTLYVVSQNEKAVEAFDLTTGKSEGVIIKNLPDAPEQLLRSSC